MKIQMLCDIKNHLIREGDIFENLKNAESVLVQIQSPRTGQKITLSDDQWRHYTSKSVPRIDIIGQNGNYCLHYDTVFDAKPDYYDLSKYNRLEDLIAPMPHFRGSAFKYILRAGNKDKTKEIEDLKKAKECLKIEIDRLKTLTKGN